MGISVIGGSTASGGVSNNFVVDMNDTTNNVATLDAEKPAGSYAISLSSGDTSFDIYVLNSNGGFVGYTNQSSLVAPAGFSQIAILGVANSEVVSFEFVGPVSNATEEGTATGAGAYILSASPSDLASIDDTTNVTGGNFATDVEVYFESGATSLLAKNIVRTNATTLIVTRPDNLDPTLDPWNIKVINPGVTTPSAVPFVLVGAIDAGATPQWSTTSPLPSVSFGTAYSTTLVATDADGAITYSVVAGTLPTGLSLNSTTGVISGTTTGSSQTVTVRALDDGGNFNDREFTLPVQKATGGTVTQSNNYTVHTFTSTDDFVALTDVTIEYLVVAGGGSGANGTSNVGFGGGGGGGVRSSISGDAGASSAASITAGTYTCTVGAGGAATGQNGRRGGSSSIAGIVTATGGGGGVFSTSYTPLERHGASGGGGTGNGGDIDGGTGSRGGNGGRGTNGDAGGGGGGGGLSGTNGSNASGQQGGFGGNGTTSSATGSAVYYGGGGGGGSYNNAYFIGIGGLGGGGNGGIDGNQQSGQDGLGGGGGGGNEQQLSRGAGGDGIVIVRYL